VEIKKVIANLHLDKTFVQAQIVGGNSVVLKSRLNSNSLAAIKIYKGDIPRVLQMYNRELSAIKFLKEYNFTNIPEIIKYNPDPGLIIFKWFDGSTPVQNSESIDLISEMCHKLFSLSKISRYPYAAIDFTYSIKGIKFQIQSRLSELLRSVGSSKSASFEQIFRSKLSHYEKVFSSNFEFTLTTLSLSDMGTHNMLVTKGAHVFMDFEFFGRDSVAKMVGDFLLHPRNEYSYDDKSRFMNSVSNALDWDPSELIRLFPLLILKWSLIVLKRTINNQFVSRDRNSTEVTLNNPLLLKYLNFFDYFMSKASLQSLLNFNEFDASI